MNNDILSRVRTFIEENFLFRSDVSDLADADSLLENGVMDSTGILELVAFLEMEFSIQMSDAEIVPDNLDSIAAIAAYRRAQARDRDRGLIERRSECHARRRIPAIERAALAGQDGARRRQAPADLQGYRPRLRPARRDARRARA